MRGAEERLLLETKALHIHEKEKKEKEKTCQEKLIFMNLKRRIRAHRSSSPPMMQEIALWPSTNGAIPHFLVLPGSELSITQITEYKYFSPLKPSRDIKVS